MQVSSIKLWKGNLEAETLDAGKARTSSQSRTYRCKGVVERRPALTRSGASRTAVVNTLPPQHGAEGNPDHRQITKTPEGFQKCCCLAWISAITRSPRRGAEAKLKHKPDKKHLPGKPGDPTRAAQPPRRITPLPRARPPRRLGNSPFHRARKPRGETCFRQAEPGSLAGINSLYFQRLDFSGGACKQPAKGASCQTSIGIETAPYTTARRGEESRRGAFRSPAFPLPAFHPDGRGHGGPAHRKAQRFLASWRSPDGQRAGGADGRRFPERQVPSARGIFFPGERNQSRCLLPPGAACPAGEGSAKRPGRPLRTAAPRPGKSRHKLALLQSCSCFSIFSPFKRSQLMDTLRAFRPLRLTPLEL
ncbi:uncharacterized protein [Struthio camelus]|uniref:uncharacterized protein n=1 Tax=Struthio camelus TaxID=8801 RepID=UPI003603B766